MEAHRTRVARANARRVLPVLQDVAEPLVASMIKHATCRRGCAHCCHQVVTSAMVEGVHIADHVQHAPAWANRIPELTRRLRDEVAFLKSISGDLTAGYFLARRTCVFLDPATNDCSIYEARPLACRFHMVTSPPAWCSADRLHQVNILDPEPAVMIAASALRDVAASFPRFTGPLPEMVLAGLEYLARTPADFRAWARRTKVGELGQHLVAVASATRGPTIAVSNAPVAVKLNK